MRRSGAGRRALGLAGLLLAGAQGGCDGWPGAAVERPDLPPGRVERTVPVMGTLLGLTAFAPTDSVAAAAAEAGRAAVFEVDSLMSHYRPGSEVSRVSAAAGSGAWLPVSPATVDVLLASRRWSERSGGAFDATVGPLVAAWGFFDHDPARPTRERLAEAGRLVAWTALEVDSAGGRARLTRPGMTLDLGAIAKGYALDRAIAAMTAAGASAGMVDLGGNVAVFGTPPRGDTAWTVGIRHPRRAGELMGTVSLASGSVATSGDYEQMFEEDGVRYSHIMDPRTAEPARGVVAVTVAAADGLTADALSTILFVIGPDEGRALVERHAPDATAVWVLDAPGGGLGEVVVHEGARATVELGDPAGG